MKRKIKIRSDAGEGRKPQKDSKLERNTNEIFLSQLEQQKYLKNKKGSRSKKYYKNKISSKYFRDCRRCARSIEPVVSHYIQTIVDDTGQPVK